MSNLATDLARQLERNKAVTIKHRDFWQLPVWSYAVTFRRVKKYRLDILMRMILHVIDEMPIRRAAAIAELLVVEELFVTDLMEKLLRNQLIQETKTGYVLTPAGKQQLLAGIYEEEQEEEYRDLLFSPTHQTFLVADEEVETHEEAATPFRYAQAYEVPDRHEEQLVEGVKETLADEQEHAEGFVESLNGLVDYDDGELRWVTCYEFRLYDTVEKMTYVRVWNPLVNTWDAFLEAEIEEHEAPSWT
ncbi:hypothetical protein ACFO0S_10350 [Chryseomicrobium palamuruense]|uniref:Uncharacterized protein n=1 Tax=Chryseomicrobium palamuruense TaxID=682973 RepID=A0ABV8UYF3_9BACL